MTPCRQDSEQTLPALHAFAQSSDEPQAPIQLQTINHKQRAGGLIRGARSAEYDMERSILRKVHVLGRISSRQRKLKRVRDRARPRTAKSRCF